MSVSIPNLAADTKPFRWRGIGVRVPRPKCEICSEPINHYGKSRRHASCLYEQKKMMAKGRKKGVCVDCGVVISDIYRDYCRSCSHRGERNYKWIDGKDYRIRKMNAEGSHTKKEWELLKKAFDFMCLCCKQQEPFVELTKDHVVPLSRGGNDYITNIQPLCRPCNARKYATTMDYRINYSIL